LIIDKHIVLRASPTITKKLTPKELDL
jgi:hypothetical protein